MEKSNYSEKDFQDYAYGNFPGDSSLLEEFLRHNLFAQSQVAYYKTLYKVLKEEQIPSISLDFANNIVGLIEVRKKEVEKIESTWRNVSLLILSIIFLIAISVTIRSFSDGVVELIKNPFFMIAAILVVVFVYLFASVENNSRKTIFNRYQDPF